MSLKHNYFQQMWLPTRTIEYDINSDIKSSENYFLIKVKRTETGYAMK